MPELTKDSRRALKAIYTVYRTRRKAGQRKSDAVRFTSVDTDQMEGFDDAKSELRAAGFIRENVLGEVFLENKAIIFLENFTTDALLKWVEVGTQFIAQFIP